MVVEYLVVYTWQVNAFCYTVDFALSRASAQWIHDRAAVVLSSNHQRHMKTNGHWRRPGAG